MVFTELDLTESLIIVVAGLVTWAGHYFPWRIIPGAIDDRGELRRLLAYGYGVGCILGGLACWCAYVGEWVWFGRVSLIAISVGAGALLPRLFKREAEHQAMKQDRKDYEQTFQD